VNHVVLISLLLETKYDIKLDEISSNLKLKSGLNYFLIRTSSFSVYSEQLDTVR